MPESRGHPYGKGSNVRPREGSRKPSKTATSALDASSLIDAIPDSVSSDLQSNERLAGANGGLKWARVFGTALCELHCSISAGSTDMACRGAACTCRSERRMDVRTGSRLKCHHRERSHETRIHTIRALFVFLGTQIFRAPMAPASERWFGG